eukprot:5974774-Prymnesium_polylepis.2
MMATSAAAASVEAAERSEPSAYVTVVPSPAAARMASSGCLPPDRHTAAQTRRYETMRTSSVGLGDWVGGSRDVRRDDGAGATGMDHGVARGEAEHRDVARGGARRRKRQHGLTVRIGILEKHGRRGREPAGRGGRHLRRRVVLELGPVPRARRLVHHAH